MFVIILGNLSILLGVSILIWLYYRGKKEIKKQEARVVVIRDNSSQTDTTTKNLKSLS